MRRTLNIWLIAAIGTLAMLGGCGTPYATVPNRDGAPVMLLGYDPVSYFTRGQPERGDPRWQVSLQDRTYYFVSDEQRQRFVLDPMRFEPQYGGFCASGAAFAIKLGSDPTAWVIRDGRLFIFGDVLGKTAWELDPEWNIRHGDALWSEAGPRGWRIQSLSRYAFKVPHYKTGRDIAEEYIRRNPGKAWPAYDPGGMVTNLFLKPPGWRAAEGFGQPPLGYPQ